MAAVRTRRREYIVVAAQPATHDWQPLGWGQRAKTCQQALTTRCDVPEHMRARRLRGTQRHVIVALTDCEAYRYKLAAFAAQLNQGTEYACDSHLDNSAVVTMRCLRVAVLHHEHTELEPAPSCTRERRRSQAVRR